MRVLQLIDSMGWGGAQKLLVTLAENINTQEVQLAVAELDTRRGHGSPFNDQLRALGVPVRQFHAESLFSPKRIGPLWQFMRQEKFDVVHCHLSYANFWGLLYGRMLGMGRVASLHNVQRNPHPGLRERLEDWALRTHAQRIIAVGHIVAEVNQPLYPSHKLDILPNAVPLTPPLPEEKRLALRTELVGDPSLPLLISVGRLTDQKGYPDLVQAMTEVVSAFPQARLIIAGGGSSLAEIEQKIETTGMGSVVKLLGRRPDIPELLSASDLFVSSSLWEGLPVAVLEAMSAGLPVAATAVGDVPTVVVPGTGLLVEPNRPAKMAEAIRTMLTSPAKMKEMGHNARQHTTTHYHPVDWANKMTQIYRDVLAQ